MTNRGRKGKPCWYIEDFEGITGVVGKYIYSDNVKYRAEGFLKTLRKLERNTLAT